MLQASVNQGHVPGDLRSATVVDIHKKGTRTDMENYRPVNLTSVICKCLERLLRLHICRHLEGNGLICPNQHGFTQGRSCLSKLLCFLDEVSTRIEEGREVEICYLDFSKAFDTVNHRLLKQKLRTFGLDPVILKWVNNFLANITFKVRIGQYSSKS